MAGEVDDAGCNGSGSRPSRPRLRDDAAGAAVMRRSRRRARGVARAMISLHLGRTLVDAQRERAVCLDPALDAGAAMLKRGRRRCAASVATILVSGLALIRSAPDPWSRRPGRPSGRRHRCRDHVGDPAWVSCRSASVPRTSSAASRGRGLPRAPGGKAERRRPTVGRKTSSVAMAILKPSLGAPTVGDGPRVLETEAGKGCGAIADPGATRPGASAGTRNADSPRAPGASPVRAKTTKWSAMPAFEI